MTTTNIELLGVDRLIEILARYGRSAVPALGRALTEEAQEIFARSQDLVPHDEGVLMSSGMVHYPNISGDHVVVEITYGGGASAYAAYQHETVGLRHDPGRSDHYLQIPYDQALSGLADRITDRVEAIVRGLY